MKKSMILLMLPFLLTGCGEPGLQGQQGERGLQGEIGDKGPTGEQGEKGITGMMGTQGKTGEKGPTGDKGPVGDQGLVGPQGETGDKGSTGEKGPTGDKGPVGDQGLQGPQGETGDKGEKGEKGDQGPDGDIPTFTISEDGYWVYNGIKSEHYAIGEQGIQGPQGNKGPQGETGALGKTFDTVYTNQYLSTQGGYIYSEKASYTVGDDVTFTIVNYEGYTTRGIQVNNENFLFETGSTFKTKMVEGGLTAKGLFTKNGSTMEDTINFDKDHIISRDPENPKYYYQYNYESPLTHIVFGTNANPYNDPDAPTTFTIRDPSDYHGLNLRLTTKPHPTRIYKITLDYESDYVPPVTSSLVLVSNDKDSLLCRYPQPHSKGSPIECDISGYTKDDRNFDIWLGNSIDSITHIFTMVFSVEDTRYY